jgi:hypothetical protein
MYSSNKSKLILPVLLCSLITSCSNDTNLVNSNTNNIGQIKIKLYNPSKSLSTFGKFRVKYIDSTDIFNGNLSVYGQGINSPINDAVSNPIRLPDGKSNTPIYLTTNSIPVGNNRIIKVNGLDKSLSSLGNHVSIMGVTNVSSSASSEVEVSWRTTPTAKVIERLIALNSQYVSTIDNIQIQGLVDKISNNTTVETTDDIHPSLINANSIGDYINNNSGVLPIVTNSTQANAYRLSPQTISGKINGITYSVVGLNQVPTKRKPSAKVICDDPASEANIVTDVDGNYTITGVTPGSGYNVKAITDYYDESVVNNVSSGATNINFSPVKQHYVEFSINSTYGIFRFPTTRNIKVQVIVPSGANATNMGYTQSHRDSINKALNTWQNLASDKIAFTVMPDIFDNDPNLSQKKVDSDIYIEWLRNLSGGAIGVTYSMPNTATTAVPPGSVSFPINFNTMPYYNSYRSSISLATYDGQNNKIPDFGLASTVAHELGHSLGLALFDSGGTGNPHPQTNKDDLMAPSLDFSSPTNLNVSLRDLNTLRFLYEIPANITRS